MLDAELREVEAPALDGCHGDRPEWDQVAFDVLAGTPDAN
jgi:hypothetical protein